MSYHPIEKMFLNFDTFWTTIEEVRISDKFRRRHGLEPRDQFATTPDYAPHEFDVQIHNIPGGMEMDEFQENFYKRWGRHGLVQMMWVATIRSDGSTANERPIARFDNAAGALMFFMAER